jgi:hypothetical protein
LSDWILTGIGKLCREKVARMGRVENLELFAATRHPKGYHRDIAAEG